MPGKCAPDADVEEVNSCHTKSGSQIFESFEYPTSSVTILKFRSGRIGKCAAIVDCLQPYYFHTHLCGSKGSFLNKKFHSMKLGADRHSWSTPAMKMMDSGDLSYHPYQTQFETFFETVGNDIQMPLTSLADALRSHEIIFVADQSADMNKLVKVNG
jgi:predicted dehydrogenase